MFRKTIIPQDWSKLAAYLASKGVAFDKSAGIKQFAAGSVNLNYLIELDGEKYVLRIPPVANSSSEKAIKREYTILSRLSKRFHYAPRGIIYCEDVSILGAPFCVSEFREGTAIGRRLPERLMGVEKVGDRLSNLLVESLVLLHKVDVKQVELQELGSGDLFLERQIKIWSGAGSTLFSGDKTLIARVEKWLTKHAPTTTRTTLVHNDFKLDNMLIDLDNLELKAVVDWDMCTLGDPIFELAVMLSYWGSIDDEPVYFQQCRMPCEADGWWGRRQVVEHYGQLTDTRISEGVLRFYWMLALLRALGVYCQIKYVHEKSSQSSPIGEDEYKRLPALIEGIGKKLEYLLHNPLDI